MKATQVDFSPAQVARKLQVSLNFIYQQIWSGKIHATRRDGRWRVLASELERLLGERSRSR